MWEYPPLLIMFISVEIFGHSEIIKSEEVGCEKKKDSKHLSYLTIQNL